MDWSSLDWSQLWTGADVTFTIIISLTLLVMLYAMALINRQIRLLQYEVSAIENDLKLIGEEIKMLGTRNKEELMKAKPVETNLPG
jgi:hypothetical protein